MSTESTFPPLWCQTDPPRSPILCVFASLCQRHPHGSPRCQKPFSFPRLIFRHSFMLLSEMMHEPVYMCKLGFHPLSCANVMINQPFFYFLFLTFFFFNSTSETGMGLFGELGFALVWGVLDMKPSSPPTTLHHPVPCLIGVYQCWPQNIQDWGVRTKCTQGSRALATGRPKPTALRTQATPQLRKPFHEGNLPTPGA